MDPDTLSKTFGDRLRGLRTRAGLTQDEVATETGIPQAHLSKLENGHRLPEYRTLQKLKRVFSAKQIVWLIL